MTSPPVRFDDGAAYERYMGVWSRLAGTRFLDWLAPRPNLRWLDVGCGNGAFTALILERCAPAAIDGIDPSEAQLAFAKTRNPPDRTTFRRGDAMGIAVPTPPSPDASRLDAMQDLWRTAGLEAIPTHTFAVERTFADFADYWATVRGSPSVGKQLAALPPADSERLAATIRARLPADAKGRITCRAIANAVQGRVPR